MSLSVMPDLIRHPEGSEKPGFRLEFTPLQNGAGITSLCKSDHLWTNTNQKAEKK
jgi:hypothetical protein